MKYLIALFFICTVIINAQVDWRNIEHTVLNRVDSSKFYIGMPTTPDPNGSVIPVEITRIDSVFRIETKSEYIVFWKREFTRTHYYMPNGDLLHADCDVWLMNKIYLKTEVMPVK